MAKKQTKADKEFVAKIATIGISTGAAKPKTKMCQDCGKPLGLIGAVAGVFGGQLVGGPVYAHGSAPAPLRDDSHEQSLSA